jgi:phage terminase large subunit-like protein
LVQENQVRSVTRLARRSGVVQAGRIFIPKAAAWLDEFKRDLLAFPHTKFKDQVDAFSQYLNWQGFDMAQEDAMIAAEFDRIAKLDAEYQAAHPRFIDGLL